MPAFVGRNSHICLGMHMSTDVGTFSLRTQPSPQLCPHIHMSACDTGMPLWALGISLDLSFKRTGFELKEKDETSSHTVSVSSFLAWLTGHRGAKESRIVCSWAVHPLNSFWFCYGKKISLIWYFIPSAWCPWKRQTDTRQEEAHWYQAPGSPGDIPTGLWLPCSVQEAWPERQSWTWRQENSEAETMH